MKAHATHAVWGEIAPELTPRDFRNPHEMDVTFLRVLSRMRRRAGVPFRIVSDHRPLEHNERVGGASGSAHMQSPCKAVDLSVANNYERFKVIEAALAFGCQRIGIYDNPGARGRSSGSVHVDFSSTHPQPRIWTRY